MARYFLLVNRMCIYIYIYICIHTRCGSYITNPLSGCSYPTFPHWFNGFERHHHQVKLPSNRVISEQISNMMTWWYAVLAWGCVPRICFFSARQMPWLWDMLVNFSRRYRDLLLVGDRLGLEGLTKISWLLYLGIISHSLNAPQDSKDEISTRNTYCKPMHGSCTI